MGVIIPPAGFPADHTFVDAADLAAALWTPANDNYAVPRQASGYLKLPTVAGWDDWGTVTGGDWYPGQYEYANGVVSLRGLLTASTAHPTNVAQFPPELAPDGDLHFLAETATNQPADVKVGASGLVSVAHYYGGGAAGPSGTGWLALDGIKWPVSL